MQYEEELKAGKLPEAFAGKVLGLLTRPDKNSIEYKAMEAAAGARGVSPARLMLDCGGIASPRALHEARFLAEFFPHGTGFPAVTVGPLPDDLPRADVQAFSIDDITTTEIDDAFSVEHLADGRVRIGVHIAAPALGIVRGDPVDAIARTRLSTVYMPGDKITMLPDDVVDVFTLKEGDYRPALSLYIIVNRETQEIVANETRAELVFVKSNLRHNHLDGFVNEETLAAGTGEYPHKDDIAVLWPLAQALFEKRHRARGLRPEARGAAQHRLQLLRRRRARVDHAAPPRVAARPDRVGFAILANSTWAPSCTTTRCRASTARSAASARRPEAHADADDSRAARRPRRRAVRVEHVAAAPLRRPREPVATARVRAAWRHREARRAVRRRTPICTRSCRASTTPTRPTPTTSAGWSISGACAGSRRSRRSRSSRAS